ncbi:MAG TPA: NADH-quinone oxidoreductase subunit L [Fibrobacteres bacterium]|nr:NADH-quinone oxidoreductase subunit L [Fibrobacterota bacterium]
MHQISFLLLFPLIPAILLAFISHGLTRNVIVWFSSLALIFVSIGLATNYLGAEPSFFSIESPFLDKLFFAGEIILSVYLLWRCLAVKKKEIYIPVLIVLQAVVMIFLELSGKLPQVENAFYVDNLSIIMVLIIGIIGTIICIYALGYMKEYHEHHTELKDKRRSFFFIFFIFLSAMFGVVLSNNLIWLYFFWEVTTLCSFEMIGYSKTEEATRNAFRALGLNLVGGLGFVCAIVYMVFFCKQPTIELDKLIYAGPAIALVPACFICFAGLAKSAQLPFSSWLLGAMVAPTPVSALLHSSTMVKAGVFIIIKMAPVLQHTNAGLMLAGVGGITFLMTSLLAVSQSNAKRVLAYSTIGNLGLIVTCAGVGTYQAIWAAILLVIFHALAKGLLFMAVGTTEHKIGSRDIEDMGGLIVVKPLLGMVIIIGIAGMFLAPFGMLISKWACLKALIDASPILAVLLAYGSAPTLFFWSKWMGKIMSVSDKSKELDSRISGNETTALVSLAIPTVLTCLFFPLIASKIIEPYSMGIFGQSVSLSSGNIIIMLIMLSLMILLPLGFHVFSQKRNYVNSYLAGANVSGSISFKGAMGSVQEVKNSNYYLTAIFGEAKLTKVSHFMGGALIFGMFLVVIL